MAHPDKGRFTTRISSRIRNDIFLACDPLVVQVPHMEVKLFFQPIINTSAVNTVKHVTPVPGHRGQPKGVFQQVDLSQSAWPCASVEHSAAYANCRADCLYRSGPPNQQESAFHRCGIRWFRQRRRQQHDETKNSKSPPARVCPRLMKRRFNAQSARIEDPERTNCQQYHNDCRQVPSRICSYRER